MNECVPGWMRPTSASPSSSMDKRPTVLPAGQRHARPWARVPVALLPSRLARRLAGRLSPAGQRPADRRQFLLNLMLERRQAGLNMVQSRLELEKQTATGSVDRLCAGRRPPWGVVQAIGADLIVQSNRFARGLDVE